MALTEKGMSALGHIKTHFPTGSFSAADLSAACGEKIVAATLNAVANNGYLNKLGGTPVQFEAVPDFVELLANAEETAKKGGCDKTNLEKAKRAQDDEFYTRYEDIEAEVMKYRKQFRGKVVYLPCDDPAEKKSEFWSFFVNNFDAFGLKKLIATHYSEDGKAYKIWIEGDISGDGYIDDGDALQEDLIGNGDFRSPECIDILNECDIVCTNPPFSLFRDFVAWIHNANKQFLIIGRETAFSYQEIFRLFKSKEIWTGFNKVKKFYRPDGSVEDFGNILWYTNFDIAKKTEDLIMTKTFNTQDYLPFDTYPEAVNVNRVDAIPKDYKGIMGVPISFMAKINHNQFEIVGLMATTAVTDINFGYPYVDGKKKFARVLIRCKN